MHWDGHVMGECDKNDKIWQMISSFSFGQDGNVFGLSSYWRFHLSVSGWSQVTGHSLSLFVTLFSFKVNFTSREGVTIKDWDQLDCRAKSDWSFWKSNFGFAHMLLENEIGSIEKLESFEVQVAFTKTVRLTWSVSNFSWTFQLRL